MESAAATDENDPAPLTPSHFEPESAAAELTTKSATVATTLCDTDTLTAFEQKMTLLETGKGSAENDEAAEKSLGDDAAG